MSCSICGEAWAYHEEEAHFDTDTDDDDDPMDPEVEALLAQVGPAAAAEQLHESYIFHKKRWRQFAGRPPRRARFFARRRKGKGKGHGSAEGFGKLGKGVAPFAPRYLCSCCAAYEDAHTAYFKDGKGSGKGGKNGAGRRNPIGKDGQVMRCSICNSE